MVDGNRALPERRLSAAERRAGRRFIAQLMDQFPRLARLAYPVRGDDNIVYIRMPIPPGEADNIDEFSAALTGIIFEQEKIRVLLIPDEFPVNEPILNDAELKASQAQLSCDVDALRKLRKYRDREAQAQQEYYAQRMKAHMERIIAYLNSPVKS